MQRKIVGLVVVVLAISFSAFTHHAAGYLVTQHFWPN